MKGEHETTVWQGIYAGLIGYLVIVIVFAMGDLLVGRRLFYTPALLGSVLFYGLTDPSGLIVRAGPVIAYNGAHLVIFLILGVIAAWLTFLSEWGAQMWYLSFCAFLLVMFHALAAVLIFTQGVRAAMPMWAVSSATGAAAIAMIGYLLFVHPGVRHALRQGAA